MYIYTGLIARERGESHRYFVINWPGIEGLGIRDQWSGPGGLAVVSAGTLTTCYTGTRYSGILAQVLLAIPDTSINWTDLCSPVHRSKL